MNLRTEVAERMTRALGGAPLRAPEELDLEQT
jgi:hypothetical protein